MCKLDAYAKTNVLLKTSDTDVLIIMFAKILIFKAMSSTFLWSMALGTHAIIRCDYNPSFFQKGKIRPYKILIKKKCYQKDLKNFAQLTKPTLKTNLKKNMKIL